MKKLLSIFLSIAMVLSFVPSGLVSLTASAEDAAYIDAGGEEASLEEAIYTKVTAQDTQWTAGWYLVEGEITINNTVTLNGDVNLVLADGAVLTVNSTDNSILGNEEELVIYGQDTGTGKLVMQSVLNVKSLTVNGGVIEAYGENGTSAISAFADITIDGGEVYACGKGNSAVEAVGKITINNGKLYAESDTAAISKCEGLYANDNIIVMYGESEADTVLAHTAKDNIASDLAKAKYVSFSLNVAPAEAGKGVAEVGGVEFSSVEAAAAMVEDGGTIKLVKDINKSVSLSVGKKYTLDLNGHSIKNVNDDDLFTVNQTLKRAMGVYITAGEVTITDTAETKGAIVAESANDKATTGFLVKVYGVYTENGAVVTIDGVEISATNVMGAYGVNTNKSSTLKISGCQITAKSTSDSAYGAYINGNSILECENTDIRAYSQATICFSYGVYIRSSKATISGGLVSMETAQAAAAVYATKGSCTITDVEITAKGGSDAQVYGVEMETGSTAIITGGEVTVNADSGEACGVALHSFENKDGTYATSSATIESCEIAVTNKGGTATGVKISKPNGSFHGKASLTDCVITAASESGTAYGVCAYPGWKQKNVDKPSELKIAGGKINATTGSKFAYGVYINASEAEITDNAEITAKGESEVIGISCNTLCTVTISGDIKVTATNTDGTAVKTALKSFESSGQKGTIIVLGGEYTGTITGSGRIIVASGKFNSYDMASGEALEPLFANNALTFAGANYIKVTCDKKVLAVPADASKGGTLCATVADAITAAGDGGTVYLLDDIKENVTIAKGSAITIDLNGHVLDGNKKGSVITNNGNLTIQDSNNTAKHEFGKSESKTVIYGGVITGGKSSFGGGVYSATDSTLIINGCTIYDNEAATYGGGIYNDSVATITNCIIKGNTAEGNGGGIYNKSVATITNCTIAGNMAEGNGGGIFNDNKATITGCTVTENNTADSGSDIMYNSGILTVGGNTTVGDVYAFNTLQIAEGFNGKICITTSENGWFFAEKASDEDTTEYSAYAECFYSNDEAKHISARLGGLYIGTNEAKIGEKEYATLEDALAEVKDGDTITILLDRIGSVVLDADAKYTIDFNSHIINSDGAISFEVMTIKVAKGDVTINRCPINAYYVDGAVSTYGIYTEEDTSLTLNNAVIVATATEENGAATAVSASKNSKLTLNACVINVIADGQAIGVNCGKAVLNRTVITATSAQKDGIGVAPCSSVTLDACVIKAKIGISCNDDSNLTVIVNYCEIDATDTAIQSKSNAFTAIVSGSAITGKIDNAGRTVLLSGIYNSYDYENASELENYAAGCSKVDANVSYTTIVVQEIYNDCPILAIPTDASKKATLCNTVADAIVDMDGNGTVVLFKDIEENVEIGTGKTITLDLNGHILDGNKKGSVITNSGTLTINDSNPFTENTIGEGESATKVYGGVITGGTGKKSGAFTFGGGVVNWNPGSKLTVNGVTITGNSALSGGGIYNNKGKVILNGVTITGNTEANSGGGVYSNKGTATLTDCVITDNEAATYGGGIYNDSVATITNCIIKGNTAEDNGGGIYNKSVAAITNCTIEGNAADFGGGIYNKTSTILVVNTCTITGNEAKGNGGGILNDGDATLNGCTISDNEATTYGGGISNSGTATLNSSTVTGNKTQYGGGISNESSAKLVLNGSTVTGNKVTGNAAGIYAKVRSTIDFEGEVNVYGNTKAGKANNLFFAENVTFTNATTPIKSANHIFISYKGENDSILGTACAKYASAFRMDDSENYFVSVNGAGELYVAPKAAQISGSNVKFCTLEDAIKAAKSGDTIKLIADTCEGFEIDRSIIIDLNGYNMYVTNEAAIKSTVATNNIKITNSNNEKSSVINVNNANGIEISGCKNLVVENIGVTSTNSSTSGKFYGIKADNCESVKLDNCIIKTESTSTAEAYAFYAPETVKELTVIGGSYTATGATVVINYGIYFEGDNMTAENVKAYAENTGSGSARAINVASAEGNKSFNVTGGEYTAKTKSDQAVGIYTASVSVIIENAKADAESESKSAYAIMTGGTCKQIKVTGGEFTVKNKDSVAYGICGNAHNVTVENATVNVETTGSGKASAIYSSAGTKNSLTITGGAYTVKSANGIVTAINSASPATTIENCAVSAESNVSATAILANGVTTLNIKNCAGIKAVSNATAPFDSAIAANITGCTTVNIIGCKDISATSNAGNAIALIADGVTIAIDDCNVTAASASNSAYALRCVDETERNITVTATTLKASGANSYAISNEYGTITVPVDSGCKFVGTIEKSENANAKISIMSGISTTQIPENYLGTNAEGRQIYFCIANTDEATMTEFPYMVVEDVWEPVIDGITDGATYCTTQKFDAYDIHTDVKIIKINGEEQIIGNKPYTFVLAGNVEKDYVIYVEDKCGNHIEYTIHMVTIASLSEKIDDLDLTNVKSSNEQDVLDVQKSVKDTVISNATQAELDELNGISEKCEDLLEKIDEIRKAIKAAKDESEKYTVKSVNSVSIDSVNAIEAELVKAVETAKAIPEGNLTEEEIADIAGYVKVMETIIAAADHETPIIEEGKFNGNHIFKGENGVWIKQGEKAEYQVAIYDFGAGLKSASLRYDENKYNAYSNGVIVINTANKSGIKEYVITAYDSIGYKTETTIAFGIDGNAPELKLEASGNKIKAIATDNESGIAKLSYSYDKETWYDYTEDTEFTADTEVFFKAVDNVGNEVTDSVKTEKAHITGDTDEDGKLEVEDAIYLLRAVMTPEDYPLYQPVDFNGDGKVDTDDAIYLLRHIMAPEEYPIG